jgi:cell wall-associated NlpC family hydrolase
VIDKSKILRTDVVLEALSWIGTPYHRGNPVKRAGCDCGSLLIGVYETCGLIPQGVIDELDLHGDWWNHSDEEKYLLKLMRHARKVLDAVCYASLRPAPGNIIMTRVENTQRFNHGAIITKWPYGVHAVAPAVSEVDLSRHHMWAYRPVEVYDPWEAPE